MAVPTIYLVTDFKTVPDSATGGYACVYHTTQHQTREAADARYFEALASAARNTTNPKMGAILFTDEGQRLDSKCYILGDEQEQA